MRELFEEALDDLEKIEDTDNLQGSFSHIFDDDYKPTNKVYHAFKIKNGNNPPGIYYKTKTSYFKRELTLGRYNSQLITKKQYQLAKYLNENIKDFGLLEFYKITESEVEL